MSGCTLNARMNLLPTDWRIRALIVTSVSLLVCLFLAREIDFKNALALLVEIDWPWLLAGLACFLVGHVFRYFRYLMIWDWKAGWASASVTCLHGFASYLMPLRLGELVLPVLARRLGEQTFLSALGGLIWMRLFDVVLVVCLAILALIVLDENSLLITQAASVFAMTPDQLTGVPAQSLLFVVTLMACFVAWWMLTRFQALSSLRKRVQFVLSSLLVWSVILLMNYGIAASVGLDFSFPTLVWLVVGTTFAYALPAQGVAGLGVHQLIWYLALAGHGVERELALELTVATHIIAIAYVLVLGALGLLAGWAGRRTGAG